MALLGASSCVGGIPVKLCGSLSSWIEPAETAQHGQTKASTLVGTGELAR